MPSPSKQHNQRASECPEPADQQIHQRNMPFNQVPFSHHRNQESPRAYQYSPPRLQHPPRQHNVEHYNNQHDGYQHQFEQNISAASESKDQNPDDVFFGGLRQNNNLPQRNKQQLIKDPDVWDPAPRPVQQVKKKQALPPQQSKQKQQQQNPFKPNEQPVQKNKRDYKKPWLANAIPQSNAEKTPTQGSGDQKKFLYYHYPDGVGPDTDLINTLEREVVDLNPNVKFDQIAELDSAKDVLQEAVLLPILMPGFFKGIRRPLKGALLFGPPGTGKTMLAKAVATIGKTTFFNVSASSVASKWKGESEKLVRLLFEMARFYAPSTIFIDEIDALGSRRGDGEHEASRKVKTEMLIQMDGIASEIQQNPEERKTVMVLAATNRPWDLDEALIRRLERRIYIPLPSQSGREQLFKISLGDLKVDEQIDWNHLVRRTEGYSGADIANVCREAAMLPMRRKLKEEGGFRKIAEMESQIENLQNKFDVPLIQRDFEEAIKNVNKSVSNEYLTQYDKWMKEFGNV